VHALITGHKNERDRRVVLTAAHNREAPAMTASAPDPLPGRTWRNLKDTADAAPVLYFSPRSWYSWRHRTDFYNGVSLDWLWVDVIIRQQSKNTKSIDDFCHLFHGAPSTGPMLRTYTFDDVVNTLNQIVPYDWRGFWIERLTNHGPGAPLDGIAGSGWKLVYDETPSEMQRGAESNWHGVDVADSIGLDLREDGRVGDTIEGMPAATAGIGPGMKLIAVNGRKYSAEVLRDALKAGKNSGEPLDLLVENDEYYKTYKLDYHGGERYPHLVRDESKPDLLSEIYKAK